LLSITEKGDALQHLPPTGKISKSNDPRKIKSWLPAANILFTNHSFCFTSTHAGCIIKEKRLAALSNSNILPLKMK
jgi:hypothetical protein